jgi:acyl-CoA reductase-like NAD-dependent aldehyde dehydrogenase
VLRIDALGPDGEYRPQRRELIADVIDLAVVPRLYVTRSVAAQRKASPLPLAERERALCRAAEVFTGETVAGLDYDEYVELTRRVAGLPIAVARAGADVVSESLTTAFDAVRAALPAGATLDWREQRSGAVWARRGEVLAVHAPGNAPGVHGLWPQALALGYRVAVRPSRREPLTAHRVITALRRAGFRDADATYLPTDHAAADDLVRAADRALVYGGQDVADRYAGDASVFVNGPGRTKILITADCDWREYLDVVVDSVGALAGMACVNTTAVLVEGDAPGLARALAARLADVTALPTMPLAQAEALAAHLALKAAGSTPILGADQVVADRGDGFAALRPAVHLLDAPTAALDVELPFPCVWVTPWTRADGIAPLRHSLLVTAITGDDDLVERLVQEPTVAGVYRGRVPTHHAAPHVPHDGFLADFLMRNKGFVVS